jgi:hypothetical protein
MNSFVVLTGAIGMVTLTVVADVSNLAFATNNRGINRFIGGKRHAKALAKTRSGGSQRISPSLREPMTPSPPLPVSDDTRITAT